MINIDNLRVLVIGGGGREHALVWKLAQSPHVADMWCAPGNPGIARETLQNSKRVSCMPTLAVNDILGQRDFAKEHEVNLTVFGSEAPLVLGGADFFEVAGLTVCGPNKVAARLEGSKCFAQEFAKRHNLPFAQGECFDDATAAKVFASSLFGCCVVKADGLCDGKGAFVCRSVVEANRAIDRLLIKGELGEAGKRIVIQKILDGFELSLHILCDGKNWKLLPTALDYKRLLSGNEGPQTGGMGSLSPHPFVSDAEARAIAEMIMKPFLCACEAENILFRGLLYPGIIVTKYGPIVIEFNVRFGDPETQVIVPRLKTDLAELLYATAYGRLAEVSLEMYEDRTTVCVVISAPGYPKSSKLGKKIAELEALQDIPGLKVFYAGIRRDGFDLITAGGRILGVTARGRDLSFARLSAYEAAREITIEGGSHMRDDIGSFGA